MAFTLALTFIAAGLLASIAVANRAWRRRRALSSRVLHRRQLEDLAGQVGLSLRRSPLGARIAGAWQGREVVLEAISGGGVLSESEVDLVLTLTLRHHLPPGAQLWRRGQPGPARLTGEPLPGTPTVMMRAEQPRQLSALISRPGTVAALTEFFESQPAGVIAGNTIQIHRRSLDDLPARLLEDAARVAEVLDEGIEAPWIAAARDLGLTPRTTTGRLEMIGQRSGLPIHIQLLEDPVALSIFAGSMLPPGSSIRRRSRGQVGGQSTGSPIADQLLIVHGPITAALRSPQCAALATEAIHGLPGSQVDEDGVRLVVLEIRLDALSEHLDLATGLAGLLAAGPPGTGDQ